MFRKILLISGITFFALLVFREIGLIPMSWLTKPTLINHDPVVMNYQWEGPMPHPLRELTVFDAQGKRHTLRSESESIDGFIAEVKLFTISGSYLPPLRKSGRCAYRVELLWKKKPLGRIEGKIDLSIWGPCTTNEYRTMLWDTMVANVREYLEDRTRPSPSFDPRIVER